VLHVKKGDKVIILSGDDKGKTGKVLQIFPKEGRAIVEGVNMVFHHKKPRSAQDAGGIVKSEAPIYLSKLQVVCPECGAPARMGFAKVGEDKSRVCKKCGKAIDTKEAKKEKEKKPAKAKKEKEQAADAQETAVKATKTTAKKTAKKDQTEEKTEA
jgi:large subunit ribosomal protein L24